MCLAEASLPAAAAAADLHGAAVDAWVAAQAAWHHAGSAAPGCCRCKPCERCWLWQLVLPPLLLLRVVVVVLLQLQYMMLSCLVMLTQQRLK
jgi:hypothetical protein